MTARERFLLDRLQLCDLYTRANGITYRDVCGDEVCIYNLMRDALAYIQQLEAERDAAVEALKDFGGCMACNSASVSKKDSPCRECILDGQVTHDYWIWRGVQKE